MAAYAPSIYAYRSEMEWQTAMAEWLAENEPRTKWEAIIWKDGQELRVECDTEESCRRLREQYPIPQEILDQREAEYFAQHPEGNRIREGYGYRSQGRYRY